MDRGERESVDVVVVGAGFAGLYMLHRLRKAGWSAVGIEAGNDVGGTWYWNRYPGARCDIESLEYSYSFDDDLQQEWEWSERFASQPEILRYLQHVAERFELRPLIRFDTRVTRATFDETEHRWLVDCDDDRGLSARFVVMATGCLSSANLPDIAGRDDFTGATFHTGRWPHEPVDFSGQRVGVIGTGSSAVQSIPIIAEAAEQLTVFQRTPTYSIPAWNRPLDPDEVREVKANYRELREANLQTSVGFGSRLELAEKSALEVDPDERERTFDERWHQGGLTFLGAYTDLLLSKDANEAIAEFVRGKIRGVVHDPEVAERLIPTQVIGCKRLCLDSGYYETFNRENVRLVDISADPIARITPNGIELTSGDHVELDAIVFATGFDAMTGSLLRIDIRGRDGVSLRDAWAEGPKTYLGLAVPQFPNLFLVTGPGSPSVLTNMVVSIEHHVDWITSCLDDLRRGEHETIEATPEATEQWVAYVNAVADMTLFPTCNSWYLGANIPGKKRVFMPLPGFAMYAEQCADVAAHGYRGFEIDRQPALTPT